MEIDTSLQNAGFTKDLRIAFAVCDVNSEHRRIQVNSADFKVFLPYTFIIQIHFFTHIFMDIPTDILTHNCETAFLSFGIITDSNSQGYETIKMKKCHVKHFFNFFLFSITERIKNCTLLTKCHIGCSDKIIYSLFQPFYPRQTFFWMASSSSLLPIPIYLWVTFTLECCKRVLTSSIL